MIAIMSAWKAPKRVISRWPRWPLHHRLRLWWASSHPCQFYLSSKKTSILILFPKNLHFCIAGIHVLLLPLLFQHIFHDQLCRLCNMGRSCDDQIYPPILMRRVLISVHTEIYTLFKFTITSWYRLLISVHTALNWTGCLLLAISEMEAPGVGKTNQGRF